MFCLQVELKEQELSHEDVVKNLKKVSAFVHIGLCKYIRFIVTMLIKGVRLFC